LTDRIVVPAANQEGLKANLAEHFGRTPYFAVVDLNDNGEVINVKTVPNVGEHAGGMGYTHDHILGLQRANAKTVGEVVTAYKNDQLQELTEGCQHAHNP
jgi:hypothetical protein